MPKFVEQDTCFPDDFKSLGKALFVSDKLKTIHNPYTGNKKKIIVDIWKTIIEENIPHGRVLDLFSGSGIVGLFFKMMGSHVISNDLLTFPYLTSLAFIENTKITLSKSEIDHLLIPRKDLQDGFIFNSIEYTDKDQSYDAKYVNARFLPIEAYVLDSFYKNLEDIVGSIPENITRASKRPILLSLNDDKLLYKMSLALTLIINHVMRHCYLGGRLNRGQILAELEFRINRQSHKEGQAFQNEGMSFKDVFIPDFSIDDTRPCFASQSDAISIFEKNIEEVDLIYIDPPYGGQQSDYMEMYRFCEEYIWQRPLMETPCALTSKKFTKKKGYAEDFRLLLSKLPKKPVWIISYNDSSWSNIENIKNIVSEFRSDVIVKEIEYEYQYRKHADANGIEYLIIGRS